MLNRYPTAGIAPTAALCRTLLFSFLLCCAAPMARAGRPMAIDDASVIDAGLCQVETYAQRLASFAGAPAVSEYWLAPACNPGGNWEFGIATGRAIGLPAGPARYGRVQAKTILQPITPDGWGLGLVLADQYQTGQGIDGNWTINVPLSIALRDGSILWHLNAGWLREPVAARHRHSATWGSGAEWRLTPRVALTAEVFGQQNAGSHFQFGASYALLPDRVQIDCTWGQHFSRSAGDHFISLGMVFQSAAK